MKTKMIIELVKMEVLPTTTNEQIFEQVNAINSFIEKQDGFIAAELIKAVEDNTWYFIYHIENMEKLKTVGEKIRRIGLFNEIMPLLVPGSMKISFFHQLKKW